MRIAGPKRSTDQSDRQAECDKAVESEIASVMNDAFRAGWSPNEVVTAAMAAANAWYLAELEGEALAKAVLQIQVERTPIKNMPRRR